MAVSEGRKVSIMLRDESITDLGPGGHRRIGVFVGRNPGARGKAGQIILRADEWEEIKEAFASGEVVPMEIGEKLHGW